MRARVFTFDQFTGLHDQAKASPRLRQHLNIHASHEAPFQRLFIAFGLDSYVRPHRHHLVPKDETLIAVQGLLGVLVLKPRSGPSVGALPNGPIWQRMPWAYWWLGWWSAAGGVFKAANRRGQFHERTRFYVRPIHWIARSG